MIFYEVEMSYEADESRKEAGVNEKLLMDPEDTDSGSMTWIRLIKGINTQLGADCYMDGEASVYIWKAVPGRFDLILAVNLEKVSIERTLQCIREDFSDKFAITQIQLKVKRELSTLDFNNYGERGASAGYINRWTECTLKNDFFDNISFKVGECMIEGKKLSLKEAGDAAAAIMADSSLYEELNRIYSDENSKKYYGNPVHYAINCFNEKSAMDIVKILVEALYSNNRVLGKRIAYISEITEHCYREADLKNLIMNAQGCTVVVDMAGTEDDFGGYATAYKQVIDGFNSLIKKYHTKTLFIFVTRAEQPGFSERFLQKVRSGLDIIDVREGSGGRTAAQKYLNTIIRKGGYSVKASDINEMLGKARSFSVTEIYEIYEEWFKNGLRTHIYKAYADCAIEKCDKKTVKSEPYDELKDMIGLDEIKSVVDEIICASKLKKLRTEKGLGGEDSARHMIFTGNPGSAKTTVARLVAGILRMEGVLETGKFVECGRADLVGKYVGWTAKIVKEKFREARGGVLFIDEAYSLVDDSNTFGAEAINTIVMEMENHRSDVIVIFAGYPKSMEKFMDANEGLRSRIAFHLNFPDYNPQEMVDIISLMAKNRGYRLEPQAVGRCREIFEAACGREDFGNGRFARNLLEQAENAQAKRLCEKMGTGKLTKAEMSLLKMEDFNTNTGMRYKEAKRTLGFVG